MSFHEKSAWLMGLVLAAVGVWYTQGVIEASKALGATAPPSLVAIAVATLVLIIGAVACHIIIAILNPSEADGDADERDRIVLNRAGNVSGYVLGVGAFAGLWHYYMHSDGNMLFHIVAVSLILSQLAEYVLTIVYYRRGV